MDRVAFLFTLILIPGCASQAAHDAQDERRTVVSSNLKRHIGLFPACAATAPRDSMLSYDCKLEVRAWMQEARSLAEELRALQPKKHWVVADRNSIDSREVYVEPKPDPVLVAFDQIASDVATFNWGPPEGGWKTGGKKPSTARSE